VIKGLLIHQTHFLLHWATLWILVVSKCFAQTSYGKMIGNLISIVFSCTCGPINIILVHQQQQFHTTLYTSLSFTSENQTLKNQCTCKLEGWYQSGSRVPFLPREINHFWTFSTPYTSSPSNEGSLYILFRQKALKPSFLGFNYIGRFYNKLPSSDNCTHYNILFKSICFDLWGH
jgi:hypothetical protein